MEIKPGMEQFGVHFLIYVLVSVYVLYNMSLQSFLFLPQEKVFPLHS